MKPRHVVLIVLLAFALCRTWEYLAPARPTLEILSVKTNTVFTPGYTRAPEPEFTTDTNGYIRSTMVNAVAITVPPTTNQIVETVIGYKDKNGEAMEVFRTVFNLNKK